MRGILSVWKMWCYTIHYHFFFKSQESCKIWILLQIGYGMLGVFFSVKKKYLELSFKTIFLMLWLQLMHYSVHSLHVKRIFFSLISKVLAWCMILFTNSKKEIPWFSVLFDYEFQSQKLLSSAAFNKGNRLLELGL